MFGVNSNCLSSARWSKKKQFDKNPISHTHTSPAKYHEQKKIFFVPTVFKFAKDTIGCGDVFLAIFGLAYTSKLFSVLDSTLIAHIAAGIHANHQGNENFITNKKLIETVKNIIKE